MDYKSFSRMLPEEQLIYNHKIANRGAVIPDVLVKQWAQQTAAMLKRELKKRNIGNTYALEKSIDEIVNGTGDVKQILFSFLAYGKYVDMGVGKGRSLAQRRETAYDNKTLRLLGQKITRSKKGKFNKKSDWQWYSKSLYGSIFKGLPKVLTEAYGRAFADSVRIQNVYEMYL